MLACAIVHQKYRDFRFDQWAFEKNLLRSLSRAESHDCGFVVMSEWVVMPKADCRPLSTKLRIRLVLVVERLVAVTVSVCWLVMVWQWFVMVVRVPFSAFFYEYSLVWRYQ
jgi:hypothetical protein